MLTEPGLLVALWYRKQLCMFNFAIWHVSADDGATGLAKSNFTLDSYQTESMLKSAMTN